MTKFRERLIGPANLGPTEAVWGF